MRPARLLLGIAFYVGLILRHHSLYAGERAFYAMAQGPGGAKQRAAVALLESSPAKLAVDWQRRSDSIQRDRLSSMAVAAYVEDETLSGYGDEHFTKGGERLEDQQRGLILPVLEEALSRLPPGSTVLELGTGNGDVAAHVAQAHPGLHFVGIDFHVDAAQRAHGGIDNLRFVVGYPLDLLEAAELRADLVFGSSTFIVFTPLELARYVRALREARVSHVVLNEPSWGPYEQTRSDAVSFHLEGATWFHNYAGYLAAEGFHAQHFAFAPYQPPASPRPDVRVLLLHASRSTEA